MNTLPIRVAAAGLIVLLSACTDPGPTAATAIDPVATTEASRAGLNPETKARADDDVVGEQLLADVPGGWRQILSIDRPGLRMAEFVPETSADSSEDWTEKISFESLAGRPLPDPIEFVNALSEDQEGTCEGFQAFSTFSGLENGYPTTVHLLLCRRSKLVDKSQVTMIKVIQGNDYFYVVSRSRRGPALAEDASPITETEVAGWTLYLRAISACNTTDENHPCP